MIFGGAAVPALVAEGVLRVIAPPPDTPGLFVTTTSATDYIGRAGARGLVSGAPVAFNRFGLRDRDYAVQKPAGTLRIIALGDSMTFGVGVPEPRTFPRVTEALLNESTGRSPAVEVLNFGIPGYNTLQEMTEFKELGVPLRPDIVVVGFLYNDLELSIDQRRHLEQGRKTQRSDRSFHVRRVGTTDDRSGGGLTGHVNRAVDFAKRHSLLLSWLSPRLAVLLRPLGVRGVGLLGDVDAQFVEGNPEWRRVQSELLELKSACDHLHAKLVVMIIPALTKFDDGAYPVKGYHVAVSRFCAASSIPYLDLLPAFWGLDGTRMWISPTDGHPNAQGHQIIANALAQFLRPLVTDAARDGRDTSDR